MKYWRGYLVAVIIAACSWGLREFAASHTALVDMIYPYMTRVLQTFLAQWSSQVSFSVWQVGATVLVVLGLMTAVLMVVLKWNPVQLFGWVLAIVSLFSFAETALYGLNHYAGPLAEDVRLQNAQYAYSVEELEKAAVYYREFANSMSNQISRKPDGTLDYDSFEELSAQMGTAYETLVNEKKYPVFSGSTLPVKKLELDGGVTQVGKTYPLTGESVVDPRIPAICMPFAMGHEMAHRMSIAINRDADFAAFLACDAGGSLQLRYSGYFMAYRACYKAMEAVCASTGDTAPLKALKNGESDRLQADIRDYESYFGRSDCLDSSFCDVLVIWHIETVILPQQEAEEQTFNPTDKTQVDLSGIVNATP